MKTDFFQSCGHCWVFQICWHIDCNTLTSSFRIWNSLTGIPSPPLSLFVVMLPKTYLTSHSRIALGEWFTWSWLSGSWSFLCSSSVCSYDPLISSASVRSIPFLSFIVPIFARSIPLVSNFLEEISRVSHSIFFPLFLFIDHWTRLFYLSLLFFGILLQMGLSFLFSFAFRFPSFLSYL